MDLLRTGKEGRLCKLNAILTFKEWLLDFASSETQEIGQMLIKRELQEVKQTMPHVYPKLMEYYRRIENGERDLYF